MVVVGGEECRWGWIDTRESDRRPTIFDQNCIMLVKSKGNQIALVALAMVVYFYDVFYNDFVRKAINIPTHLLNHKVVEMQELIPTDVASALLNDIKKEQSFPTNIQDTKF